MEIPGFKLTREAGADLSARQFHFVKLNSSGQIVTVAAVTDIPIGILQDNPAASGRAGEVMVDGVSEVIAGAALTPGNLVGLDSTGRAIAIVAGTATTQYTLGQVLIGCANAAERATILFSCAQPSRAA